MNVNAQKSYTSLNSKRVPVLPPGTECLLKSLSDESMDFEGIAHSIENFPAIEARLIGLANSAWSSPVSPVTSIETACSRLGLNVVRSTCIALIVASPFNSTLCSSFSGQAFWCRALLVAEISSWLAAASSREVEVNTARTAGLLHNLGILFLADQMPREMHQAFDQHNRDPDTSLSHLMMNFLGYGYTEAGSFICNEWGIPPSIVNAIQYHRDEPASLEDSYTRVVSYACAMVQAAEQENAWVTPLSITASLGIRAKDAERIYCRIDSQIKKTHALAKTLFNLA